MSKPRLLYLAPQKSSFVQKDLEILAPFFYVVYSGFNVKGSLSGVRSLVRQLFFLLRYLWRCEGIIVMFGGYHSLLPSILGRICRKRVYIILGGTDCVSFPSINYGTFRKRFQGKVTCFSYRLAHRLLPVHHSLIHRENDYYSVDSIQQGCQYWCKNLGTPYTEIHNGYDPIAWYSVVTNKALGSFVTIAAIPDPSKIVLKGIDLVVELARSLPHCTFTIIGLQDQSIDFGNQPNVLVLPFLPQEELREILATTQFYLQLSISEGFPNALCEAMLAQCVPIGSNVAAIPDIIGDTGFILMKRDLDLLKNVVALALSQTDLHVWGMRARNRISSRYPLESRSKGLLNALRN